MLAVKYKIRTRNGDYGYQFFQSSDRLLGSVQVRAGEYCATVTFLSSVHADIIVFDNWQTIAIFEYACTVVDCLP